MKLIENYALISGQRIRTPSLYCKYFPTGVERYITLSSTSKPSKTYSFWNDVIYLIKPILDKNNISIIQIGGSQDVKVPDCIDLCGKTNLGQTNYIISKSLLHLTVDTFTNHVAGIFDIPSVSLYSNNYTNNVSPYFGSKNKQIYLEPDRNKFPKPSFSFEENPKTIDTIKPEDIAVAVCKLLNLPFDFNYKTIYIGELYKNKMIETVPDQSIHLGTFNLDTIIQRHDIFHSPENLYQQLQISNVIVVTNKEFDLNLLTHFRSKIKQFVYFVDDNHNPSFAAKVLKLGIPFLLHTYKDTEWLNEIKFDYLDIGIIIQRKHNKPQDIEELKTKNFNNLYYRSNKILLSQGKIYPSVAAYRYNLTVPNFGMHLEKIIDTEEFWKELDYFTLLEKNQENKLTF